MSIEEFTLPDSPESGSNSAEVSEKYKESSKKAAVGIRRTQKDEGKAQKYDFLLAKFLVKLILEKRFDDILPQLFACLDAGYGSNFLLGILSLVYIPISHEIRRVSGKPEIQFTMEPYPQEIHFDANHLPLAIRNRVNAWIEDIEKVLSYEVSTLVTQRTLSLMLYDEKIRIFTRDTFRLFFQDLNIQISQSQAQQYVEFILGELEKSLKKYMPNLEKEWESEGEEI